MNEEKRAKLEQIGVNVDDAMERFMGSDRILEKFLKTFPEDTHFSALQEAFENRDFETAFAEAHALKGICGNLSLEGLFQQISNVVELLRAGQQEEALEGKEELQARYEATVEGIQQYFKE